MSNQTILITGGNAGIGLATAKLFASNGYNVAIIGRRAEQNESAAVAIKEIGASCLPLTGDVTDETFIRDAVARTKSEFGGLHHVFNNAGVEQVPSPLPDQTIDDYRKIIDVNVMGVWLVMRETIPTIIESGGGCVVNTSSVAGLIGMVQIPLYIAAKHAVIGLTKAVALEYAQQGVRINAVCPGAVQTDLYDRFTGKNAEMEQAIEAMHPMGRSGTPEEVASAVLYLCRDATWTTGQSIVMDGGFTAQ
ncbi:SDR family NAD(P)-dependent oxidoreductase [Sulfuriroseicoccus oceanibius]|uniref:Glucose 1-dehydrogenase n=1 Tax=Sulfuriroseicoccus oceanibius TaxID=2707525 RepID=A0A6B3LDD7_9BACT|nr:glucose 1-dehydrogenase [Sulfuriroseicoccus oceanibius]QQL44556.1 glucose 1-dehydrogenase [Sulfuriroseicoccus oceanibius]